MNSHILLSLVGNVQNVKSAQIALVLHAVHLDGF